MKFLIDANVLSEAAKEEPVSRVIDWMRRNKRNVVVNPIVLGELEYGILLLPLGRRRARLQKWFAQWVKTIRSLDLDADTGQIWASLLADLKRKGRAMPLQDSLIAATARQYHLTVVTRNVDDFRHAGVALINPFEA